MASSEQIPDIPFHTDAENQKFWEDFEKDPELVAALETFVDQQKTPRSRGGLQLRGLTAQAKPGRLVAFEDFAFDLLQVSILRPAGGGATGSGYYVELHSGYGTVVAMTPGMFDAARAWIAAGMPTAPDGEVFDVMAWHKRQGSPT